jgi:hypothetical protein
MNNIIDRLSSSSGSVRQVKIAKIEDIPGIISVLQQNLIAHKNLLEIDILEQKGFLINAFTDEDAKTAILDKDNFIFLISSENDDVIGYAVGCNVKKLNQNFQKELAEISLEIHSIISSKKLLYLRHIAKKLDIKHVGKGLLQELINQAKHGGYEYIICTIAEKPIQNKASKAFHEKFDFACTGYNQDGDKTMGVYLKKI